MNEALESGYKLIQELFNRFGTTLDLVQRFITSKEQFRGLVAGDTGEAAKTFQFYSTVFV